MTPAHSPASAKLLLAAGIFLSSFTAAQGVVRQYEFNVTRGVISPDGFQKPALLINGQFPGPQIEANYGDTFQVTVNNYIEGPGAGTSFHWHGILQTGTPWYDGVAGVTQCPIAPGQSMTYTFKADRYGTSFYHAHYSSQYVDGLFGPMVIHGPEWVPFDIDLGPVLLTDYFHNTYEQNLALLEGLPPQSPVSDNNLINGKNFNKTVCATKCCNPSKTASIFRFETGKVHKLSLINAGAEGMQRFGIDEHTMTVISHDFVPIEPYETNVVTLGAGQRAEVLVKATGSPKDAVWMRSDISTKCGFSNQPHALAIIYYPEAPKRAIPTTQGHPVDDSACTNEPLEKSVPRERQAHPSVNASTVMTTTLGFDATTGRGFFYINNSTYKGDYNNPILLDLTNPGHAKQLLSSPPPNYNIYDYDDDKAVRLIIVNPSDPSHPMHLHGHEFFILAEGFGTWDGKIANPSNPARKDTHTIPGGTPDRPSYLVLEFIADNPGAWAFHCHIAWHQSLGFYVNILDHPGALLKVKLPRDAAETCRGWDKWAKETNFTQIDAGP